MAVLVWFGVGTGIAHGPWHEQLAALDAALEQTPGAPHLLLSRAELHRADGAWDRARQDVRAAEQAGAEASRVAYARANIATSAGEWSVASVELAAFLPAMAEHAQAWRLCAAIHHGGGDQVRRLHALQKVVATVGDLDPDDFLVLARVQREQAQARDALATLEEGLRRLGPVSPLIELAVEIEVERKDWDAALARMDAALGQLPNTAHWLARKGDLAAMAGRPGLAGEAWRGAMAALKSLPEVRQTVPANLQLAEHLQRRLAEAGGPLSEETRSGER